MKIKTLFRALAALAAMAACGASLAAAPPPKFKIGDPAPAIDAMAWIQGEPVKAFKPGHVYVVEFWATWCGPCKAIMPHLTELQKKHAGKLTVIGVNARESDNAEPDLGKVTEFVKKNAAKMAYTVAMDDPVKKTVFDAWMINGGSYGIPTSFVVDGKGTLVWMGHPLGQNAVDFDAAVEQALAGKSDLARARVIQAEVNEGTYSRMQDKKKYAALDAAQKSGNHAAVIAEADKLIAESPQAAGRVFVQKAGAMLKLDEKKALETFRADSQNPAAIKSLGAKDADDYLMNVAYAISSTKGLSSTSYQFAVERMEKAALANPKNFYNWLTVASLYDRMGKPQQAVTAQQKAIAIASTDEGEKPFLPQMQEALKTYESKVGKT